MPRPKPPRLKHVKHTWSKGRWYSYFNTGSTVDGKAVYVRLPEWGTPGFHDSYARMLGHRNRKVERALTFRALLAKWEASDDYGKLKPSTRRIYMISTKKALKLFGEAPADHIERRDIWAVLDNHMPGNASRKLFVAVMATIYRWGRQRDLVKADPTSEIRIERGQPYEPWPDELLEKALNSENPRLRLFVALAFYTGQRIGDVLALRWDNVKQGRVSLVQQKTGKPVDFPQPAALATELARTPRKGLTIVTRWDGGPISQTVISGEVRAFLRDNNAKSYVIHGLRKNAVNALLLAGCTVAEVSSITGQSFQIVEHYARQISRRQLGDAAILKLDQRGERNRKVQTSPKA